MGISVPKETVNFKLMIDWLKSFDFAGKYFLNFTWQTTMLDLTFTGNTMTIISECLKVNCIGWQSVTRLILVSSN